MKKPAGAWHERYAHTELTLEGAVRCIPKGKSIFIASGAAEPVALIGELVRQKAHFAGNQIVHLLTLGPAPYVEETYRDAFRHNAFFIGPNVREAVHQGRADYTPVFLSQIPDLIRSRRMPVDVALIQCSPPDPYGFVNLGVSVDVVLAAVEAADLVIAQINPRMPVIFGAGFLPMARIHGWVLYEDSLPELPPEPLDDVALEIGRNVASLIEDGATLQMGIGQIPDATLKALFHKKDLGVWTEMFSDGVIDLIENGNITGKYKSVHPRKVTSSFTFGSERLYRYVDCNPTFTFHPSDYTNNPMLIARQHKMVAINSALQVDLTGQVCADSIGTRFYSGIGGQVDFIRGASMCPGGKPIIAIRSTARGGTLSRIVASLSEGAGVVTSRGDVRYVVTEYGIADLLGTCIRDRARALISIAHPDFQAELLDTAKARHYVFPDQIAPRIPYRREYEKRVTLDDGQEEVLMRPVRLVDESKINDFFYRLSEDSVRQRWMGAVKQMPRETIQKEYLDVDYASSMAVLVETVEDSDAEPETVGVVQYFRDPATDLAEVALVVRDDWQGRGVGTQMLRHMVWIARRHGIVGFTAEVLATNRNMLHVFHQLGLKVDSILDRDVYHLRMPFGAGDNPPGVLPVRRGPHIKTR